MIPISFLALAAALTTAFYKFVVYPAFFSPLAKVPTAHWSCRFSSLWYYYMKWSNQENAIVYGKHMELGSAVRLAPNVLSINCYEGGVKSIYQGGFPKPVFYFRGFAIYGYETYLQAEQLKTDEKQALRTSSPLRTMPHTRLAKGLYPTHSPNRLSFPHPQPVRLLATFCSAGISP